MLGELVGAAYLCLPLLGGAAVHGACMRYGWLARLARPIDAGKTLRGRPLFGHSKTWRGPIAVAAGASVVFGLQRHCLHDVAALASLELVDYARLPGWWFGALLGAAAELSELPNSFVKRQLGIEPGGTARGLPGVAFFLWDQLDILLGFWVVFAGVVAPTPLRVAATFVVVGGVHPLLTVAGYLLGMRPTAR
jgi:hypothetical protein